MDEKITYRQLLQIGCPREKKVSCFILGEKVTKFPSTPWKKGLNCSKGASLIRKYKG
jgi:hypothetical protein